jgi:hypothetical protein
MHGALSPTTSPAHLLQTQAQAPAPTTRRPAFFSAFRTHLHLPFPLFSFSKPSTTTKQPKSQIGSGTIDEEAQHTLHPTTKNTSRFSAHDGDLTIGGGGGVETNIWSPPAHTSHTHAHAHAHEEGARAHRERERRELEDEKGGIAVRDEVRVESAHLQSLASKLSKE